MQRLSDEKFIELQPNMDNVYGIRIKNGEFYLLAYMENAEHYNIKHSLSSDGDLLLRDPIVSVGEISSDENVPAHVGILWELDDAGNLIDPENKKYKNAHEYFLSFITPYTYHDVSDGDHDIFLMTKNELSAICDALRDGDYVIITE